MDIGAILETGVMIILGYGIMFGIIVLLMLPFLYSINLYERMKNHRLVTQDVKIRDQRLQLSQLSETNHQLVRILIDMRESLRH
jgi:hypothetical protein